MSKTDTVGLANAAPAAGRRRLSAVDRHALVRALARRPGGAWVTCAGPSMEPTIRRGDRVRVVACRRLLPGDVAVFETAAGDALVLHRVVFKVPGITWFFHVGDNGRQDAPGLVHTARVIGRVPMPRRLAPPRVWLACLGRLVGAVRRER